MWFIAYNNNNNNNVFVIKKGKVVTIESTPYHVLIKAR